MPANALLCKWQLIGYKYRFIRRVQHKLPDEHGLGQGGLPALRIHDRQLAMVRVRRIRCSGQLHQTLVGAEV